MICSKLALDGLWQLSSPEMPGVQIPMTVPGDNYSALFAAGIIPDPYWGTNEQKVQKYAGMQWHLEQDFTLNETFFKYRKILLELERLDTLVSVFINGHHVLDSDNMFRRYRIDVKKHLQQGKNQIKLIFHPVGPRMCETQ